MHLWYKGLYAVEHRAAKKLKGIHMGNTNRQNTQLLLAAAVIGFALYTCAMWTARSDAAGVSYAILYLTRFTTLACYIGIAFTFRNHIPSVSRLFRTALTFVSVHLACEMLVRWLANSPATEVLCIISGLFEGAAMACVTLMFAHVFSSFSPRKSSVAIATAYLVNEMLILALFGMEGDALWWFRVAFKVSGLALLGFCVFKLLASSPIGSDHPIQYGMSQEGSKSANPLRFLSSSKDWAMLLASSILFPTLFGLIAQICSGLETKFGLYDYTNEFAAIALLILLVIYVATRGTHYGFVHVLAFTLPFFATGCAVLPILWNANLPYAGTLVKCGYTVFNVLLMALLARKSFEDPRHVYLYFGIFCGISTAQFGRLGGNALLAVAETGNDAVAYASLAALWLLCMFSLLIFVIARKGHVDWSSEHPSQREPQGNVPHTPDPFSQRFEQFCIECGLTEREREVLVEAVHGYSRDNIAKKLYLSPETVKTYLKRAYTKAGVTTKQDLIAAVEKIPLDP